MKKINYECETCGHDNEYLMFKAEVWWDEVDQVWEVESVDNFIAYCTACEEEVGVEETSIVEEDKQSKLDFGEYDGDKVAPKLGVDLS